MSEGESPKIEKVISIKVSSLNDIVRFAASLAGLGQPTYIIRFELGENKTVYGMFAIFRDYYKLYGLPIFYYYVVENDKNKDKTYVLLRHDEWGERIEFDKGGKPGWITIPIITLGEKPRFVEISD